MKSLFGESPVKKYFFSSRDIPPSRSPFIKLRLTVLYTTTSLEELVQILTKEKLICNNFKFARFKLEDAALDYDQWLHSATELGKVIQGEVDMQNPSIQLGITILHDQWIFGIYEQNGNPWEKHNLKPYTNSNSLETRTARAIVNIAVGQKVTTRLVDPCCGIGTVVLEALSLAVPVHGYELSWPVTQQAKQNVAYFGYDDCIEHEDMHWITETYDVAILDLPYGLFSHVSYTQQKAILNSSRNITKKLVLVTCTNMDEEIASAGFSIVDRCTVTKGRFVRYVRVCC